MIVPTVVVGCDASPASGRALRFAADEARLRHARLLVTPPVTGRSTPTSTTSTTLDAERQQAARARTESALRRAFGQSGTVPITTVPARRTDRGGHA